MKFLSNPGSSGKRRLYILLALPLLLHYHKAVSQNLPDSAFEKLTISILKTDASTSKIKEVQRLTFLYLNGFTTPEQRRFYYRYRDSAYTKALQDTLVKPEGRKKLAGLFDSAGVTAGTPLAAALDALVVPKDTALAKLRIDYQTLAKEKEALQSGVLIRYYVLGGIIVLLAILAMLFRARLRKSVRSPEEQAAQDLPPVTKQQSSNAEAAKKAKKLAEDLKKIKNDLSGSLEQNNKLQQEKVSLEREKEQLASQLTELGTQHKIITESLDKTEKEKQKQEELSIKLQEDIHKLTAIQKEQEEQSRKMNEIVSKLETVAPPVSFPDINSTLHAWFLLQEFIKGYRNKEFSVLSTPNFSKWVLKEDHTYPELDVTNLAGNAPVINFLIDLKKRKITSIAPDGTYMVLINQKITQQIFDSLEPAG